MNPEARALYERGLGRFQAHDYPNANAAFEAGYAVEPRREFLFAEGQAKRLAGDCKGAVALYQRFLTTAPPPVQVNATQIALGRCAQQMAERPDVVAAPPLPPRPPAAPAPRRWWHDPWGLGAVGAGVVGLGVGVSFWLASNTAAHDATAVGFLVDYGPHWSTAETRRTVAITALAAGTVLTAAGAVRLVLLLRQGRARAILFPIALGPSTYGLGGVF